MEPVKHRKKEIPDSHASAQIPAKTTRFKQRAIKSALVFTAALVTSPFALGQENKKPDLSNLNKPGIHATKSQDKLALLMAPKGGAGPSAREISGGDVVTIPGRDWRSIVDPDTGLALGALLGKSPRISVSELEQLATNTLKLRRQYNPDFKPLQDGKGYSDNQVKVPRPEGNSLIAADAALGGTVNAKGEFVTFNCAWISFLDENGERQSIQISLVPVLQLYELITGQKAKVVKILAFTGSDENGPYIGFFFCPDQSLDSEFRKDLPNLFAMVQGEVYSNCLNFTNDFVYLTK